MFRYLLTVLLAAAAVVAVRGEVAIMGESRLGADELTAFVRRHNPDFDREIAEAFVEVGRLYGIRGDVALCQAVLETGWFRFADGTAVTPDQNNFCGMGVTRGGMRGARFKDVREGVTAMMQHLYAYCSRGELPEGETLVDPRFTLVRRGSATTWEGLSNRWAMNPEYGRRILSLYERASGISRESLELEEIPGPARDSRELLAQTMPETEPMAETEPEIEPVMTDHPDSLAAREIALRRLGVIF